MVDCPKCRQPMTPGFLYLPDAGGGVMWMDGNEDSGTRSHAGFESSHRI